MRPPGHAAMHVHMRALHLLPMRERGIAALCLHRAKASYQQTTLDGSVIAGTTSGASSSAVGAIKVWPKFNKAEQAAMVDILAGIMYKTNMPLSWVENPDVLEGLGKLMPWLPLPSRFQLANGLLVKTHDKIRSEVVAWIHLQPYFSVSTDLWSRTQGGTHIINVNLCSGGTSVFIGSIVTGEERCVCQLSQPFG